MSTVRIYKVAELLNAPSQEVMDLLKVEAGIEVRSASSTIEEVVARQFVERHARKRNISLPPAAQMFNEGPPQRPGIGKKQPGKGPAVARTAQGRAAAATPAREGAEGARRAGRVGGYAEAPAAGRRTPSVVERPPRPSASAPAVERASPRSARSSAPAVTAARPLR